MTVFLLDDRAKGYLIAFMILNLTLSIFAIVMRYHIARQKKVNVGYITLSVINFFYITCLMVMNRCERKGFSIELSLLSKTAVNIPWYIPTLFSIFMFIITGITIRNLYQDTKRDLNVFSIKEAIENLKTAIAFIDEEKEIVLSNRIMENLSIKLCGHVFLNGDLFYEELLSLKECDNCVIKSLEPAFMLEDKKVWQFTKKTMQLKDKIYYQIIANDITELYHLNESTAKANEKLHMQQNRLKELTDKIEKNTEEEVALKLKVNFHDNFGNLLALTKKTLREENAVSESNIISDYWNQLNKVLCNLSQDNKQTLSLEQIELFANKLGCNLVITGLFPIQKEIKAVTLLCINEALKNAYRHANANSLMVNIEETKDKVHLKIYNEDREAPDVIYEGGGLSNLRYKIEQLGGVMDIICSQGITLDITLNKRMEE